MSGGISTETKRQGRCPKQTPVGFILESASTRMPSVAPGSEWEAPPPVVLLFGSSTSLTYIPWSIVVGLLRQAFLDAVVKVQIGHISLCPWTKNCNNDGDYSENVDGISFAISITCLSPSAPNPWMCLREHLQRLSAGLRDAKAAAWCQFLAGCSSLWFALSCLIYFSCIEMKNELEVGLAAKTYVSENHYEY